MLWLVRFAVARPITTLMGCLMVVLLGTVALSRLPIDLLPDITYPTITVTTPYEGAGPAEIETLITRPLEQTLGSVHGLERLMSSSYEGISNVRVQLRWGTNIDEAMGEARAKVEMARRYFPEGVQPPYVQRYDVSDSPIIFVGLTGELDPVRLTRLAEQTILPRLESVDGVARVRVRGGLRREIQVNLDRTKIEALNLSVGEVVDVLRRENVNQPAGSFSEGDRHLLIRPRGEFRSLAELGDTMVREHEGAAVRIRDIANIVDGTEEQTEVTRVNGKPGLLLSVFRQAGYNAVDVSNNLRRRIDEINASLSDAKLAVRIDRSEFIRQSVGSVKEAAISGMLLTVVILVLFLQNLRSTIVVLVSMPLSILATFVMIYLKGYTLNMISFGGLALGIGMLVDNSIVVLESIFCKRDEGMEPKLRGDRGDARGGDGHLGQHPDDDHRVCPADLHRGAHRRHAAPDGLGGLVFALLLAGGQPHRDPHPGCLLARLQLQPRRLRRPVATTAKRDDLATGRWTAGRRRPGRQPRTASRLPAAPGRMPATCRAGRRCADDRFCAHDRPGSPHRLGVLSEDRRRRHDGDGAHGAPASTWTASTPRPARSSASSMPRCRSGKRPPPSSAGPPRNRSTGTVVTSASISFPAAAAAAASRRSARTSTRRSATYPAWK